MIFSRSPRPSPEPVAAGDSPNHPLGAGSILSVVGLAALLTVVTDFLVWPARGGTSFAILLLILSTAFVGSAAQRTPRIWLWTALAILSATHCFYRFSWALAWVPLALLLLIVGEAHFAGVRSYVARLLDVGLALFLSIAAWRHVFKVLHSLRASLATAEAPVRMALRALQAVLPALLLAIIFSAIFSAGNAIFAQFLSATFHWIFQIDLTIGRIIFWLFIFTILLALLRPIRTRFGTFLTAREIQRWRRDDERMAVWQSAGILAVLSALFFFINTLDAIYLWSHAALPEGVSYSEFVHRGVASLITAVLVSACVLALIFQQRCAEAHRGLQWLATLWVLQNLVLIAGVFLRLKLYVDAYQMTLLRVGVALFLGLVIFGYALLTLYFWRSKSLTWLCKTNLAAAFALFFLLQFTNFSGWVADYNVNRWLGDRTRTLDIRYIADLGPEAWPSLVRVVSARAGFSVEAAGALRAAAAAEEARLEKWDWREWQFRRESLSAGLNAFVGSFPTAR